MAYKYFELQKNVYHIADPIGVFMTLIVGEEKALLFDTGYALDHLDATLRQITPLPVVVVNSHGHLDHVLGNWIFDEVHIHPADLPVHKLHTSQGFKRSVTMMRKDRPDLFPDDFSAKAYLAKHKARLVTVEDGQVFNLGGVRLEVVHIPGHTPGGIALLDDRDRLLLGGDSVSRHVWMFLKESTSLSTYIQSLEKLKAQADRFDHIVASHTPVLLKKELLDQLIHCAKNLDFAKSAPYQSFLPEPGWMYYEGGESLETSLGLEPNSLARAEYRSLDFSKVDFSAIDFVSIVANESKM